MTKSLSYLGDNCIKGIMNYLDKITKVEKQAAMMNKERYVKLEDKVKN